MSRIVRPRLDDVHLWVCDCADPAVDGLSPSYRGWCHEAELARESRFHFARDRRRHLLTRALVRWVLSRYAQLQPDEWCFATNAYGKPYVRPGHGCGLDLCFNVSHAADMIVMAVAKDRALGLDLERWVRDDADVDDLRSCLTDREYDQIKRVEPHRQKHRFLQHWTLKEAYLKARGIGLNIAPDKLSFDIGDAGAIVARFDGSLHENPRRWGFWQIAMGDDHLAALCAERMNGAHTEVTARMCLPLAFERPLSIDIIGRSDPETRSHETTMGACC